MRIVGKGGNASSVQSETCNLEAFALCLELELELLMLCVDNYEADCQNNNFAYWQVHTKVFDPRIVTVLPVVVVVVREVVVATAVGVKAFIPHDKASTVD